MPLVRPKAVSALRSATAVQNRVSIRTITRL